MKQLAIYCSRDLADRVIGALDRAGVEGYLEVRDATGNRFLEPGQVRRTITWEATLLLVPAAPADRVAAVVEELRAYAGDCEIEPCLRMTVLPVEEAY